MTPPATRITLIGCGKMGSALLKGWMDSNINYIFNVIEPHDVNIDGITHYTEISSASAAINDAHIIILAIKPQMMPDICGQLSPHLSPKTALLSIAAGLSIENFEDYFSNHQPIIRAMPNTPAAIGKGISAIISNAATSDEQKTLAHTLMSHTGKTAWIKDESLFDAITALSGSGPAYVFHLIEVLATAGENAGLDKDLSMTLARQTIIGSAALAENDPKTTPQTLRENVTSPGGTTAAALEILMNGEWQDLFDRAVKAAKQRGIELRNG